jgi:UDP-N-acetylglucosamine--N-acetylmuramyl-(pentapeptide) pyrophosphoryl-undecaprenol N-acetylglucosamine transferase
MIHEQNGVLGRVNRLFAARVAVVACGTWPVVNAPKGARLERVGNPVRPAVQPVPYAVPEASANLLVFGGSQGASVFATLVPRALAALTPALRSRIRLVQQARDGELADVRAALAADGIDAEVAPFFEDMPARLAAAHLVIARAGASTVAELAMVGRPALLVPYPAAMDDHQTANAQALGQAGAALVCPEHTITAEGLAETIAALLSDPARLAAMAAAASTVAAPHAVTVLADEVERLAGR